MGSHPAEAAGILIFLLGFTTLAAGFARGGVLCYVVAAVALAASLFVLHKYQQLQAPAN